MFIGGDDSGMMLEAAVIFDRGVPNAVFHWLHNNKPMSAYRKNNHLLKYSCWIPGNRIHDRHWMGHRLVLSVTCGQHGERLRGR